MSGVINILMDSTSSICKSYDEVLEAIEAGEEYIETNCTDFFCFDMLDKDYDAIVHRHNGTIVLSALLDDTNNIYTQKQLKKAHNVRKMLIAGAFTFKEMG
ncbi:MAG: hypothetical protein JXR12_06070 [Neptunomonas phycophila]|uniref:hypothetical protein n=1 Tax=Neptunomonas phycophila TaxID=1572645 RepID=UPI003B8D1912